MLQSEIFCWCCCYLRNCFWYFSTLQWYASFITINVKSPAGARCAPSCLNGVWKVKRCKESFSIFHGFMCVCVCAYIVLSTFLEKAKSGNRNFFTFPYVNYLINMSPTYSARSSKFLPGNERQGKYFCNLKFIFPALPYNNNNNNFMCLGTSVLCTN